MAGNNLTIGDIYDNRTLTTLASGTMFEVELASGVSGGITGYVLATSVSSHLNLGSMATQNATAVAITGGTVTATGGTLTGYTAITTGTLTATGGTLTATGGTLTAFTAITTGALTASAPTFTGVIDITATTAGQISFPATQNDSANVNILDDYEEGLWTPTLIGTGTTSGAQTYVTQVGMYTKIGNVVNLSGFVQISAKDAGISGNAAIGGIPFAGSGVVSNEQAIAIGRMSSFTNTGGYTQFALRMAQSDVIIRVNEIGSGVASVAVPVANFATIAYIAFGGQYRV